MADVLERMFAPAVEWAGNVMERFGLPRDGAARVRLSTDGTWSLCAKDYHSESPGEKVGGPAIIDPDDRDLQLACRILFEIRRYRSLTQRGEHEDAGYTVARLGELLAQVPIQAARSSGGETTADIQRQAKADRARRAVELFDQLATLEPHQRASVIAKRLRCSPASVRTYLHESGRKTKRR